MSRPMMLDLEAIKARLKAATPGPWAFALDVYGVRRVWTAEGQDVASTESDGGIPREQRSANGEFIAHAPADIAALVAEVELMTLAIKQEQFEIRRLVTRLEAANDPTTDVRDVAKGGW